MTELARRGPVLSAISAGQHLIGRLASWNFTTDSDVILRQGFVVKQDFDSGEKGIVEPGTRRKEGYILACCMMLPFGGGRRSDVVAASHFGLPDSRAVAPSFFFRAELATLQGDMVFQLKLNKFILVRLTLL